MKRALFYILILLFLSACGLDAIPQEGLTNAVVFNEGVAALFENYELREVTVNKVWTDMRPLANTGQANVTIRLELAEDVLGLGGEGPFYLYGGGVLLAEDEKFAFADQKPITAEGTEAGQMRLWLPKADGESQPSINGSPFEVSPRVALPSGIVKVYVAGVVSAAGQETAILTNNENITQLTSFQCEGTTIPGSSQASITFSAETAAGEKFSGGGIVETGIQTAADDKPGTVQCSLEGKGFVNAVFEPNDAGFYLGQALFLNLGLSTLQIRNESGQQKEIDNAKFTIVILGGVVFEIETT